MDNRDTNFSNLQPGDEITVVWTVQDDGRLSSRADGSHRVSINIIIDNATAGSERVAFVSKRQPRLLKPGDNFKWSLLDTGGSTRKIIFVDEQCILYEWSSTHDSGRVYESLPSRRGQPIYVP